MADGLVARQERRLPRPVVPHPSRTTRSSRSPRRSRRMRNAADRRATRRRSTSDPRAASIDLRKVWKKAGQKRYAQILAALGPNVPVLLWHSITASPSARANRLASGAFGTGVSSSGSTPARWSVQPTTELLNCSRSGPRPSWPSVSQASSRYRTQSAPRRGGAGRLTERCPGFRLARRVGEAQDPVHAVRPEGDRRDRGARRSTLAALRAGSPARRPSGDAADAARPEGDQAHPDRDRGIGGRGRLVRPSRVAIRNRDLRPGARRAVTLTGKRSKTFRAP